MATTKYAIPIQAYIWFKSIKDQVKRKVNYSKNLKEGGE